MSARPAHVGSAGDGASPPPSTGADGWRELRRRYHRLSLRIEGRLDGEWADRYLPWTAAAHAPVEMRGLGYDDEPFLRRPYRLGIADQQKTALQQGEMEQGDDSGLGLGQEVDQEVAA